MNERVFPSDIMAEKKILGCILMDSGLAYHVKAILREEDFYSPKLKKLYRGMLELLDKGQPITPISLVPYVSWVKSDESILALQFINYVADEFTLISELDLYIESVRQKSILRKLYNILSKYENLCLQNSTTGNTLIQSLFEDVQKIDIANFKNQINQIAPIASERLVSLIHQKQNGIPLGMSSGLIDLDNMLSGEGFRRKNLYILAARPSMGKTGMALTLAWNLASQKHRVAFFSLEMSKEELVDRLLCLTVEIDGSRFARAEITQNEWKELNDSVGVMQDIPLYINDNPGLTIAEIKSVCLKLQHTIGLDAVVIDYLQLVGAKKNSGSRLSESRQNEVSEIARDSKALAKELNVALIGLSQLNRDCERRPDKRPMLSDLRESGSLEQDADWVGMIFREEVYSPTDENTGLAELNIVKQRNGPTGVVHLLFDKSRVAFKTLSY